MLLQQLQWFNSMQVLNSSQGSTMRKIFTLFVLLACSGCQTPGILIPGGATVLPECVGTTAYLNITANSTGTVMKQRAPHLDGLCVPIPAAVPASAPRTSLS